MEWKNWKSFEQFSFLIKLLHFDDVPSQVLRVLTLSRDGTLFYVILSAFEGEFLFNKLIFLCS